MGARPIQLLAAGLALVACSSVPVPDTSRASSGECVALFQRYDLLERTIPNPQLDRRTVSDEVARQGEWIRNAGCITLTRDLAAMETLDPAPVADGGAGIPPIALHAGVVTNMADDARSTAFFSAHGVRARSVGSAPLGRRIYLGPFATQGALDGARDLALRAGFAAPYPARF